MKYAETRNAYKIHDSKLKKKVIIIARVYPKQM